MGLGFPVWSVLVYECACTNINKSLADCFASNATIFANVFFIVFHVCKQIPAVILGSTAASAPATPSSSSLFLDAFPPQPSSMLWYVHVLLQFYSKLKHVFSGKSISQKHNFFNNVYLLLYFAKLCIIVSLWQHFSSYTDRSGGQHLSLPLWSVVRWWKLIVAHVSVSA